MAKSYAGKGSVKQGLKVKKSRTNRGSGKKGTPTKATGGYVGGTPVKSMTKQVSKTKSSYGAMIGGKTTGAKMTSLTPTTKKRTGGSK